jgi:proteic killer suppression protein
LKELFETGKSSRVRPDLHKRALVRLDAIEAATTVESLRQPGFDFHALTVGHNATRYMLTGPWCLTFEWLDGVALRVDLEQYY